MAPTPEKAAEFRQKFADVRNGRLSTDEWVSYLQSIPPDDLMFYQAREGESAGSVLGSFLGLEAPLATAGALGLKGVIGGAGERQSRLATDLDRRTGEVYSRLAAQYPQVSTLNTWAAQRVYSEIKKALNEGNSPEDIILEAPTRINQIMEDAKNNPLLKANGTSGPVDKEGLIRQLIAAGFSEEEAIGAIQRDGGLAVAEFLADRARGGKGASTRTAAQESVDWAQAGLATAQADKIRNEIARQQIIDQGIRNGELFPTGVEGVFRTVDGEFIDKNKIDADKARLAIEGQRLGLEIRMQDFTEKNQTRLTDLRDKEVTGNLDLGNRRLALDTSVEQNRLALQQQQNSLEKQKYIGEVLKNPSDFISRAFLQRGVNAPNQRITQADLITQVNEEFNKNPLTFAAPQGQPGLPISPVEQQLPRLAYGTSPGYVNDKAAIVGDPQADGGPNPEIIHNPTGAPISVTPMKGSNAEAPSRLAEGQKAQARGAKNPMDDEQKKADAIGKVLQYVDDEDTAHRLVSELHQHRGRLNKYAYGTQTAGDYSWDPNGTKGIYETPTSRNQLPLDGTTVHNNPTGTPAYAPPRLVNNQPTNYAQMYLDKYGVNEFEGAKRLPGFSRGSEFQNFFKKLYSDKLQREIVSNAEANLPPALRQLFGDQVGRDPMAIGQTQSPENPSGVNPLRFGFNLFSPAAVAQLTDAEKQALSSYLAVKYNTNLDDVGTAMQQTYGKPVTRGSRLRIA